MWLVPLSEKPEISTIAHGTHHQGRADYILPSQWTLHLFLGPVEMSITGHHFRMDAHQLLLMPPNIMNHYYFPVKPNRYYYTHFILPKRTGSTLTPVSTVIGLEEDFAKWEEDFIEAIQLFPNDKVRAEIRLWDMLLRLKDLRAPKMHKKGDLHPSLQEAIRWIELNLTEQFSIAGMVKDMDISHNHLTRLFRKQFKKTILGYIRGRRMQRARHLLLNTTRSIKQIAAEVGIPDLQMFNKSVRREFGTSPRNLRKKHLSRL